jgi:hypothetical protein
VLSGFGTEDTHHTLHTLRWGFDGQLYMNQSIYIHSHIETPHGVVRLNSGGILNLRPQTMELDVFMKGLVNGWGHHFDRSASRSQRRRRRRRHQLRGAWRDVCHLCRCAPHPRQRQSRQLPEILRP